MALRSLKPTRWEYAELSSTTPPVEADWVKCKHFPTEIHWELLEAGKIPDWNIGRAEHDIQWVSKRIWAFRSIIDLKVVDLKGKKVEIELESLDTFADVYLNGQEILKADNHFLTHHVPIPTAIMKEVNELLIIFHPPEAVAQAVSEEHGPFQGGSVNLGAKLRMGVRKAQYGFRWDWGPELLTIGPDRGITIRIYKSRLKQVQTIAKVDDNLACQLGVKVEVEGEACEWEISLMKEDGSVLKIARTKEDVNWDVDAELWWPVGEGLPTRYTVKVDLLDRNGSVIDSVTRKIGFRRVELIQDPLQGQKGTSFYFKINNKRIFIGGSNWIPIDTVQARGTEAKFRKWIELLVKGNQNMIRVWGGGFFEPDIFYDLCDEMGILVWQDFMFACGVYPIFPKFLQSVKKEAECNVKRLRHHPSLALFCGNNEDYQQILQWDIDDDTKDPLPARLIYERILPDIVKDLTDPVIPYWPGSPYGGEGWDTADETTGDVHQWNVWAGSERSYHDWDIMAGRFISEFGMPSLPDTRTVEYWHGDDTAQRHPQSKMMQQHNKAGSHERRFAIAMNENFRHNGDLESYVYLTQLMQSEAVGSAYTTWRRNWKGPNKEYSAGALVWQLNDTWPVTSWAIIDYFYRPKPAYFSISRAMAPVTLGIRREITKNRPNDRPRNFYEYGSFQSRKVTLAVWGCNSRPTEATYTLKVSAYDIATDWSLDLPDKEVILGENRSSELYAGPCPEPPLDKAFDKLAPSGTVVIHAILLDHRTVVARYTDWPQPYKLLDLPNPELEVEVRDGEVKLSVEKPVKGVWLSVEGNDEGVEFGDNSLDLFPGDERIIRTKGLQGRVVTAASLWNPKASRL